MLFSLLISGSLTLLTIVNNKSRTLTVVFWFFIWVLWGFNYWNGDYEPYESRYNNSLLMLGESTYEYGYAYVMALSNLFNLSFQTFLQILSGIVIILWLRFIFLTSQYPALYTAIFFIFFLPLDYVLLRNSLAFSIVLQGIIPILKNHKYKYFKLMFFVILASLFHSTSIFYVLLALVFLKKDFKASYFIIISLGAFLLFMVMQQQVTGMVNSYSEDRLSMYGSSFNIFLLYCLIQILNFRIIKLFCNNATYDIKQEFEMLLKFNIILLLLLALYYVLPISIRLFRNVAIINSIYMLNLCMHKRSKTELHVSLLLYLALLYWLFIYNVREYTIYPLFENNLLLN